MNIIHVSSAKKKVEQSLSLLRNTPIGHIMFTWTPDVCHRNNLSLHETDRVRSPRPGFVRTAPTTWYAVPGKCGSCLVSTSRHLAPVRWMSSSVTLRFFTSGPTESSALSAADRLPDICLSSSSSLRSLGNIDASPHGVWLEKKWNVMPGRRARRRRGWPEISERLSEE